MDARTGHPGAETGAVALGWHLVELAERLGSGTCQRVLRDWWEAEADRARETLPVLAPWPGCSAGMLRRYTSPGNQSRFRRTLDFVRPGDRVVDIGLGRGYQAGALIKAGALGAYHGIDLAAGNVAATEQMLSVNGLCGPDVSVRQTDLYDLRRDDLERVRADLLICCEVLEHVPDPERALCVLADALPDGCELLVSVPLFGRLESVWGHLTVFDAARVRAMVAAAGLHVHVVEPLHNTWTLLLLSGTAAPSRRAAAALGALSPRPLTPARDHRDFHRIDLGGARGAVGQGPAPRSVDVSPDRDQVLVEVADGRRARRRVGSGFGRGLERRLSPHLPARVRRLRDAWGQTSYGGVSLPVDGLWGGRLELAVEEASGLRSLRVEGRRGTRRCVAWEWASAETAVGTGLRTLQLPRRRPGIRTHGSAFVPTAGPDPGAASELRVLAALAPGGHARFRLRRAAYLA